MAHRCLSFFRGWGLICLAVSLLAGGCESSTAPPQFQTVEIAGEAFGLELAMDSASRFRGLSGRAHIPDDGGMLFIFPSEAERTFVMRDCLVPIDILFLSPGGEVISSYAMEVEPADRPEFQLRPYRSNGRSAAVIELAGGTIERLGVDKGDIIDLPQRELKRQAE